MTTAKAKRERVKAVIDSLETGGDSARLLRRLVDRVPADELSRVGRVLAAMVRGETRMRKAKRVGEAMGRKAKKNPQLLTINPSKRPKKAAMMANALRAYKRFHGVEPAPGAIHHGDGEGVLIGLGELTRIDYRPRKGDRRGPIWFHNFKPGCVLCTDPDGRRLVVLDRHGKRLVDFDRGIIR